MTYEEVYRDNQLWLARYLDELWDYGVRTGDLGPYTRISARFGEIDRMDWYKQ